MRIKKPLAHAFALYIAAFAFLSTAWALPPIAPPPPGQSLPAGWEFWSENPKDASAAYGASPIGHMAVRIYNPAQWSLHVGAGVPAQPGQVWTFSAVVGGRSLGRTESASGGGYGAGGGIGVVAHDNTGAAIDWFLGGVQYERNSFGWKLRTLTVVAPPGTATLRPRFIGYGGGEYFVASTSFEQSPFPINTAPPAGTTWSTDWTKWQRYPGTINPSSWSDPFNYLAVPMSGTGDWEVSGENSYYGVTPGEWWTFSALVHTSGLGGSGGGSGLGLVAYDGAGGVVSWNLGNAPVLTGSTTTWTPTSFTTKIPAGVTRVRPRFTGWGGGTINYAYGEFQRAIPPIVGPGSPLPDGWAFWQEYSGTASAAFASAPNRIHTDIHSGSQFELNATAPYFPVEPGQQWTLTADLSGTNLGQGGGGVALNLVALDAAGNVITWTLGGLAYEKGTFTRKTVSKTVTVPSGVAKLHPRFYCYGNGAGSSFDIYTAKLERADYPTRLTVPTSALPPVTATLPAITVPDSRGLPPGWSRWSRDYNRGTETTSNIPVPHIAVRQQSYNLVGIHQTSSFDVQSGEKWTFTAVVSGRGLSDGGLYLGLEARKGSGETLYLQSSTAKNAWSGWETFSHTFTIPDGVTRVNPYFSGLGTGEFFIASATFLRTDDAAAFPVPSGHTPPTVQRTPTIQALSTPYQLLPYGWGFSVPPEQRQKSAAQIGTSPITHVAVRAHHAGTWTLGFDNTPFQVGVQPGETWTFTAVAGRRSLSAFPGSRTGIAFDAFDKDGALISGNAGVQWFTGTFNWRKISATLTVPTGATRLRPKFVGEGGCEFFVASTAVERQNGAADLYVPTVGLPASGGVEIEIVPIKIASYFEARHGMAAEGETVTWTVFPESPYAGTVGYEIVDLDGTRYASGNVALGGTVTFTPAAQRYYEIRVSGTLNFGSVSKSIRGMSSMVCVPSPTNWSYGSNPFGMQSTWDLVYSRAGFSWERPLYYNIVSGSHSELPTDLTAYANRWEAEMPNKPAYINSVEIWNEAEFEIGLDRPGRPTMLDFINMVAASRTGINRVSPSTKILVNFASMDFTAGNNAPFKQFQAQGGWNHANVMALHPYSGALYSGSPFPQSPENDQLLQKLANARAQLDASGRPDIEIWSTEYGWPTYPGFAWSTTELDQARFITRSSLLQLAAGLKKVIPFRAGEVKEWIEKGDLMGGSFGLARVDNTPKPAFAAYTILAQTVNDLPYVGYLDMGPNVGALLFGRNGVGAKTVLALWRPDQATSISLGMPNGMKTIVEMLGKKSDTFATSLTKGIGPTPSYIVINASPSEVAFASGYPLRNGPPPASLFNVTQ